jgi:hypothetical protein
MNIPQNLTEVAQQLGYPSALFGFIPDQGAYWREPGLPWLTPDMWENRPLGRNGQKLIWDRVLVENQSMAPRFPKGCNVNVAPIAKREHLQVGKVYLYVYRNQQTGEQACELGRLDHIGGNYLIATFDNYPTPALWLLEEKPGREFRNVHEVTHYISYPAE